MIRGNSSDFIDHPLPKDSVSAHGASHHAWAPGPHHLNPALVKPLYDLASSSIAAVFPSLKTRKDQSSNSN